MAALPTVFAQPDRDTARQAIARITGRLARRNPRITELLRRADPASLTYYSFPAEHRRQIWSTNAEGFLGDLARQCDLVGTFPGRRPLLRMVTWVLRQQDADWRVAGVYCRMPVEARPAPQSWPIRSARSAWARRRGRSSELPPDRSGRCGVCGDCAGGGPERLAHWRLLTIDWLLQQLEEIRLGGDGSLPPAVRAQIVAFGEHYDPLLSEDLSRAPGQDLNTVHDALFDAQGRVMLELSQLRRTPSWQEVERLFNASDR